MLCFAKTFSDLSVINLRVKRHSERHVDLVEESVMYLTILLLVWAKTVLTGGKYCESKLNSFKLVAVQCTCSNYLSVMSLLDKSFKLFYTNLQAHNRSTGQKEHSKMKALTTAC